MQKSLYPVPAFALNLFALCALLYALCIRQSEFPNPQSEIRNSPALTIEPNTLRIKVSRKIREEFENGRDYYALDDRPMRKPDSELAFPSAEKLRHHYENEFRG